MDGTLLNRYGKISSLNIAAIEALKRKNISFVVCTGRNFDDASSPLKEAGISCDIICMNGAAVFDSFGRQLRKQPLLKSQVNRILNICRPFSVLYDFMTEEGSYTTSTMEMSVVHENPEVLKQIRCALEKEEGISVASSASSNLELTHIGAQKGSVLMEYAANTNICPREILAIGDSENDLSMLTLPLGYTIAMGNASEVIKRSARLITRNNDEDGVAVAIDALILSDAAAVY